MKYPAFSIFTGAMSTIRRSDGRQFVVPNVSFGGSGIGEATLVAQ